MNHIKGIRRNKQLMPRNRPIKSAPTRSQTGRNFFCSFTLENEAWDRGFENAVHFVFV